MKDELDRGALMRMFPTWPDLRSSLYVHTKHRGDVWTVQHLPAPCTVVRATNETHGEIPWR